MIFSLSRICDMQIPAHVFCAVSGALSGASFSGLLQSQPTCHSMYLPLRRMRSIRSAYTPL